MAETDHLAERVLALARAGDLPGAIAVGEDALSAGAGDAGLAMFIGVICCRRGEMERGIDHLRQAVALAPGEPTAKIELARALLSAGADAEAEAVSAPLASPADAAGREMQRVQARALLRQKKPEEAAFLFGQLTEADPADFESWDGAGAARLASGDPSGAVEALLHATRLRPSAVSYWVNLSQAYAGVSDHVAGEKAARRALAMAPQDASAHIALARALGGQDRHEEALARLATALPLAHDNVERVSEIAFLEFSSKAFARAEANYRDVLRRRPDLHQPWVGLATLLERVSRNTEMFALLDAAEAAGVPPEDTALLRARALRADGRLEEAMAFARSAPEFYEQSSRMQLIGDIADRMGDLDTAFAAFSEAASHLASLSIGSADEAETYRNTFRRLHELLTPEWVAGWTPPPAPSKRPAPLFIFGFPRSGTTLIDTMLGGHPDAVVLEEEAVIDNMAKAVGPVERVANLTLEEIERLRARYFQEVDAIAPTAPGRLIVDKSPLGIGNTALLFRVFPDARFVFAERHPCDVVLSCFITSTQMDAKVANFFDLGSTALLYDRVLAYWQRCREVLPITVHTVRYERLIANPEDELRGLAEFAGLEWDPKLLANQTNASERVYIGSPSYAQVAQPIYTRARGRWLKYRSHMQGVLPILAPWIELMGYDTGEA